jgi:hypothetical protein
MVGPLSFEHVPPRAAFNDRPVLLQEIDFWKVGPDHQATGRVQQRGRGAYTLCARCNNRTGRWYGSAFVAWCHQGMEILARSGGNPTLLYLNYLLPLRIIKQICAMFFSINPPTFQQANPELVRFVLDKERRFLSPKYRFWTYFNHEGHWRTSPVSAMLNMQTHRQSVMTETSFPPFGYLLTLGSEPLDGRLYEITRFARFAYNDFITLPMQLPVLPTHTLIPGDYRTREEIIREGASHPGSTEI